MEVSENLLSKPVQAFYHSDYNNIVVLRADNTREFIPLRHPIKKCSSITIQEITITDGETHYEYGLYPHDTGDSILKNGTTVYVVSDVCSGSDKTGDCSCKSASGKPFDLTTTLDDRSSCVYARVVVSRLKVDFL